MYNTSGTLQSTVHAVTGTGSPTTAVPLSGSASFTSASTYVCYGSDTTAPGANLQFTYTSGTSFTPTATGGGWLATDSVKFVCIGH